MHEVHWVGVAVQVAQGEAQASQVGTGMVVFKKVPGVQVWQVKVVEL